MVRQMEIDLLAAELDRHLQDPTLCEPTNLLGRSQALAFAAFIRQVARARRHQAEVQALYGQSIRLEQRCEQTNQTLFATTREHIRRGEWRQGALRQELDRYTDYRPVKIGQPHVGYDGLDLLLRGLWQVEPIPPETAIRTAEMVHLEATPARAILELVDRVHFGAGECFYDLGSGLGEVVCLVHLLTGACARGVEYEPAYCAYARRRAVDLALDRLCFINADAQRADLRAGTVFFLFTPFTGALLRAVLDRLATVARDHPIRIAAYGSCARVIAQQPWLRPVDDAYSHEYKLALSESR